MAYPNYSYPDLPLSLITTPKPITVDEVMQEIAKSEGMNINNSYNEALTERMQKQLSNEQKAEEVLRGNSSKSASEIAQALLGEGLLDESVKLSNSAAQNNSRDFSEMIRLAPYLKNQQMVDQIVSETLGPDMVGQLDFEQPAKRRQANRVEAEEPKKVKSSEVYVMPDGSVVVPKSEADFGAILKGGGKSYSEAMKPAKSVDDIAALFGASDEIRTPTLGLPQVTPSPTPTPAPAPTLSFEEFQKLKREGKL
jgi:hypothetical protein